MDVFIIYMRQNERRWLIRAFILMAFFVLVALLSVPSLQAQNVSHIAASRAVLLRRIAAKAVLDVKNGSPPQTEYTAKLYSETGVLSEAEAAEAYDRDYNNQKASASTPKKTSLWEKTIGTSVGPGTVGIVAIAVLSFFFKEVLKKGSGQFLGWAWKCLYTGLSQARFFQGLVLRRYKKAVAEKYGQLKLVFRPDRPLNMGQLYVPLSAVNTAGEQVDVQHTVSAHRVVIIKGSPGSGKSMLLRSIAVAYAQNRSTEVPGKYIPLLLELHRLNDPSLPLTNHLISELARNDFPRADGFITKALNQGNLLLLLDGLDEVSAEQRCRVVQAICDLLEENRKCRCVITCRTAVYRNDFSHFADETLELTEFSDQQIRTFLESWSWEMAGDKSVEHLLKTLQSRPRIMSLARNPLMLTLIALLYSDNLYPFPHSRTEFYRQATDVLLNLWKGEGDGSSHNRNIFPTRTKRRVLQNLALRFLDSAPKCQGDHLSMDRASVLASIRELQANLDLKPEQVEPLLQEIVERSGLLLAIDGGSRYQFAHLTLQEYFAAEILDDGMELLARQQADPDTWRETAKLWCGLDHDSTEVIRKIYQTDALMAFECLADALQVDETLANEIILSFQQSDLWIIRPEDGDSVINMHTGILRAFGMVACVPSRRGTGMYDFLSSQMHSSDPLLRIAAAHALSWTNLPKAAALLAEYYADFPDVRPALILMGDMAVPFLGNMLNPKFAQVRDLSPFQDLYEIGTPAAAEALVPHLWCRASHPLDTATLTYSGELDFGVYHAAWHLAGMLSHPGVERQLYDFPLTRQQRGSQTWDWIWKPFYGPIGSSIPTIAGRIAFLMGKAPVETIPDRSLFIVSPELGSSPFAVDARLAVPLLLISSSEERSLMIEGFQLSAELAQLLTIAERPVSQVIRSRRANAGDRGLLERYVAFTRDQIREWQRKEYKGDAGTEVSAELSRALSACVQLPPKGRFLLQGLPVNMLLPVLSLWALKPTLTCNDWMTSEQVTPSKNEWYQRAIVATTFALSVAAFIQVAIFAWPTSPLSVWERGLTWVCGAYILWSLWALLTRAAWMDEDEQDWWSQAKSLILMGPCFVVMNLVRQHDFDDDALHRVVLTPWLPIALYFTVELDFRSIFEPILLFLWFSLLASCTFSYFTKLHTERQEENPFQFLSRTLSKAPGFGADKDFP